MSKFSDALFHVLENKSELDLPQKFTFPFYYEPHPLSLWAARELQAYLETQTDFNHNFGLNPSQTGLVIGKMFGVMVVQNSKGLLGYLAAFSGKLADSNYHKGFVPTVYNTLNEEGFYKKGEAELNRINFEIEVLERSKELKEAKADVQIAKNTFAEELKQLKDVIKVAKKQRKEQRKDAELHLESEAYALFDERLNKQSIAFQIRLKHLRIEGEQRVCEAETCYKDLMNPILDLKKRRAHLSASLQKKIHQQYRFLNAENKTRDLLDIFVATNNPMPPAGSGECAAPKLFQYAYENDLKPICMAEFWWGASPKSEVRKHKQFYPSCRSKCEPILGHMMEGLDVEDNPIEQSISYENDLDIVFEDEYLLLLNKPHEFLSVPGKTTNESVFTKMKRYLPNATGPLLVHRLDMSTSGLLLVAKTERIHKFLQKQFIERSIKKQYVALLDGVLETMEGTVNLPLRVDLDNRPQQLVCYEHGKRAVTNYQVVSIENGKTRIHFYPITGRTHQLRVHAAHSLGLQMPIVGDDLYGTKSDRLHLHAEKLTFLHPINKKELTIYCKPSF